MRSQLYHIIESSHYPFIEDLAKKIIEDLNSSKKNNQYSLIEEYEFLQPQAFDLRIFARWDDSPNFDTDEHFSELSWEKYNFNSNGYSINAITKFNDDSFRIPEIDVFIIINVSKDNVYSILYSRLVGIIGHELRHVRQIGINKEPFMGSVSKSKDRGKSQQSYLYFLLPEELDSMVEDKYIQSTQENKPIDDVMCQYLHPFVKDGFMSSEDFKKVYVSWIKRAIELFPDANFSKKAEKIIEKI